MSGVTWLSEASDGDYAAARSYLSLLLGADRLDEAVELLRYGVEDVWRAKDLLRAARLQPLRRKRSPEVASLVKAIEAGTPLAPVLLITDGRGSLEIADGYERICAAYATNEDTGVAGRLALLPEMTARTVTARFVRSPIRR